MSIKKKVIIFTCTGGHTTAAQAIEEYLCNTYDIVTINIFSNTLRKKDLVRWLTFFKYGSEDIYNWFLKNRKYHFINRWLLKAHGYYRIISKAVFSCINKQIQDERPVLIISVIPLFNGHILRAAHKQNIPFLLIPTDIDLTTFLEGVNNPVYPYFTIGLMVESDYSRAVLKKAGISQKNIEVIGPVLREDFFYPKDIAEIRRAYGILPAKRVILLAMGSQGSVSILSFCQMLSTITIPVHLLIVLGKNTMLRPAIERIVFPHAISITILDFTKNMSDLMAVADLLITKSGGMSVMEGVGMHLPMLLDATTEVIVWEQANQNFVIEKKLGFAIKKVEHIKQYVESMLLVDKIENCSVHFAKLCLRIAPDEVQRLVKNMIEYTLPNKKDFYIKHKISTLAAHSQKERLL